MKWCQRPERAYFISTALKRPKQFLARIGVNALNGLTSFLRIMYDTFDRTIECQRPERAYFISTQHLKDIAKIQAEYVSTP